MAKVRCVDRDVREYPVTPILMNLGEKKHSIVAANNSRHKLARALVITEASVCGWLLQR